MPNTQYQTPNTNGWYFMSYDQIAEWYDGVVRGGLPVHALLRPALHELAGDVAGLRVCDLCCGQGWSARELAACGATVTGIDISARLIEMALQIEAEHPSGIVYRKGDVQRLPEIADGSFDEVTCILALMDIEDLAGVLATVARILRPGGLFVFAITHPCFQTPDSRWTGQAGGTVRREVRAYFREGLWRSDNPHGVRGQVGAYHRTLSTYIDALDAAGLSLERMREPQPADEVAGRVPGHYEVPAVLLARCRKG
jgi:ubiquinone/menaquinone biosynthesis C-methylase UbiE